MNVKEDVMPRKILPPPLPKEVEREIFNKINKGEQQLFEERAQESPVEIIFKFLESFSLSALPHGTENLCLVAPVERYVLEALATRLNPIGNPPAMPGRQ